MIVTVAVLPEPTPFPSDAESAGGSGSNAQVIIGVSAAIATVVSVATAVWLACIARQWRERARVAALQGKGLLGEYLVFSSRLLPFEFAEPVFSRNLREALRHILTLAPDKRVREA